MDENKEQVEAVIVSFMEAENGNPILIVGKKREGHLPDIINAIQGPEARNIFEKLKGVVHE